ncbi:Ca2+-transporting ATPase [Phakopsora pachyrhizi]|nr:Ca2+-transporting ATPase [Phakopsora pachyrhizi]
MKIAAYAYFVEYDRYLRSVDGESQEWTFLLCVTVFGGHALAWLSTKWSTTVRQLATCYKVHRIGDADVVKVVPKSNKGKPAFCSIQRSQRTVVDSKSEKSEKGQKETILFIEYQRDHYFYSPKTNSFGLLAYPSDSKPSISTFTESTGVKNESQLALAQEMYGKNTFDIPVPTFLELLGEHMQAPFFVFQMFSVGLWFLDEYWYYSLFTLFMLFVFECTTVFQRLRTLNEFRTMSIKPYLIQVHRYGKWAEVMSDQLVPGDLVSVLRTKEDSGVPCDLLLLRGTCIASEAMLSGESTPLLKESVELRSGEDRLDVLGEDRNSCLFGGTKILQVTPAEGSKSNLTSPDGGCLALVLRTGFGTTQGQLVRTMIFATEQVTANNIESFLFLAFLMLFAIIASRYVWVKGVERNLKRSKLLLDCVIIITSVVPPELPMELSMAVNASLVALSKYAIFCTEPFRIPSAGRVDVCCFDKTGTITGEDLMVEGVVGVDEKDLLRLVPLNQTSFETTLTLASAHALVLLEDGVIGDPMEKTTIDAAGWTVNKGDKIIPASHDCPHKASITIQRRFQFSSLLKRMSTVATVSTPNRQSRTFAAVKGAPEVIKKMIVDAPSHYENTYKYYTRRGSRVLTLAYKFMNTSGAKINDLTREQVESDLTFAGFLVFTCPLKPDAVQTLKMLADSSHRCIMITGDNPLTAVHVAREVEIVDRDCLILDVRENSIEETDLVWRTVDDRKVIPVDVSKPIDTGIFKDFDLCVTGIALKQFTNKPSWNELVQNVWVYARVSPAQKEQILITLRSLGYITLMAGDGTNDVGALKAANVGVALLDGSPEDLKAIAEHQRNERLKKIWQTQLNISQRLNQPPPAVPAPLAQIYPELVEVQKKALKDGQDARKANPLEKFNLSDISAKMADMEENSEGPPQIKLGDASVAAPFTSKLSHVSAVSTIIRQGRCTLVTTTQMYKILASNCLISAYSLSVQYLDGVKFGDYQMTIQGVCMSACFLCISRAKPVEKLSKERPQGSIFNVYVVVTVLGQFLCHLSALVYITQLCEKTSPRTTEINLDAVFEPNLLNSAIYLLSTCQSVATFAVNFQGRPFREDIRENKPLFYGLLGAAAVAFCGATNFVPEANGWLQLVDMTTEFRFKLCLTMILDFGGALLFEVIAKFLFSDVKPREMVTKGSKRREARRAIEEAEELKKREEEEIKKLSMEEKGEGDRDLLDEESKELSESNKLRQRNTTNSRKGKS